MRDLGGPTVDIWKLLRKALAVIVPIVLVMLFLGMLSSIAPPADNLDMNYPNTKGVIAGFDDGLLHGFSMFLSTLFTVFRPETGVYETHNNGFWYNAGYFIGNVGFLVFCVIMVALITSGSRKKQEKSSRPQDKQTP